MLDDADLAYLCWACYNDVSIFDAVVDVSGVWAGVKHFPGYTGIAFRGSDNPVDWLRDFDAVMIPDPQLGLVHAGFMMGMRDTLAYLGNEISAPRKLFITGHSLGAAHALLLTGLITCLGLRRIIAQTTVFGSPRPGGARLKEVLMNMPIRSYKNGDDPVTDVPLLLPAPVPYLAVDVAPKKDDEWGPLGRHHIELYFTAMEAMRHG